MFVDIHLKAQIIALPLNSHTRSWVGQPCAVLELARFVHQIISVKASGYVTTSDFFFVVDETQKCFFSPHLEFYSLVHRERCYSVCTNRQL